jgi:hypothetical protein
MEFVLYTWLMHPTSTLETQLYTYFLKPHLKMIEPHIDFLLGVEPSPPPKE